MIAGARNMISRPSALMISPVMPASTGNGLQMRAAMTLRALVHHYRVTLLVMARYPSAGGPGIEPDLERFCEQVFLTPAGLGRSGHAVSKISDKDNTEPDGPFDLVHFFRLATVEMADKWIASAGAVHLDLDDVESCSRAAIAELLRANGQEHAARAEERAAEAALKQEIAALLSFDRVYVCSPGDENLLPICGTAEVRVLPNVIEPPTSLLPRNPGQPFTLLFVGTLGYAPNDDGLRFVAEDVLPLLRAGAPVPFRIQIVGHAPKGIRMLAEHPEIEVSGFVPSLAPVYAAAGAVIVPLRAGGGTRIKVLEAAAHRVPIVSTSIGIAGIAMRDGHHCLVADDPSAFAASCIQLMQDSDLGTRLGDAAHELVRSRYSLEAMIQAVTP